MYSHGEATLSQVAGHVGGGGAATRFPFIDTTGIYPAVL